MLMFKFESRSSKHIQMTKMKKFQKRLCLEFRVFIPTVSNFDIRISDFV